MAITFPVALATWFDALPLVDINFELGEGMVSARTAGGEVIASDYATRLWSGSCTVAVRQHRDAEALAALGRVLREARATFLATPVHVRRPAGIPVMPASPLIHAMRNGREMRISGLATGDRLAPGEFIGWSYGSSPVRRALHQVVEATTADAIGISGWFEVTPPIRDGAVTGTAVTLEAPACVAKVVPGSWRAPQIRRVIAAGFTFDWVQTLR